jgi:hypothetical protein
MKNKNNAFPLRDNIQMTTFAKPNPTKPYENR